MAKKSEKNRYKMIYILMMIIAFILIIVGGVLLVLNNNKNEKINKRRLDILNEGDNQTNSTDTTIDYKALEKELIDKINSDNNTNAYITICTKENDKENSSYKELSVKSVTLLFNKIKEAEKIEKTAIEAYCPKYTYSVTTNIDENNNKSNILAAWYGNDDKTLLVGIKDDGYVLTFSNDSYLKGFLESLE